MSGASVTTQVGKYHLVSLLGVGGMAEVWRAVVRGAAGFQREVALKVIRKEWADDPQFVTMFVDEACLSAALTHPNVVATLDFGRAAGRYFIAMEMVDGASLRHCQRHLAERGLALDPDLAVFIAAEVAAGLHHAHQATGRDGQPLDLVHRDVNPANIMISLHGEVKLSDFGIAKAAGRATRTEAGELKGKIPYMSPEQAWGHPLDRRSDLYSLGLVLHELLTGALALDAPNEMRMLEKARVADVAPLGPAVPSELAAVLGRALSRRPEDRHATAGDLAVDLRRFIARAGHRDLAAELGSLVAEARRARETGNLPVLAGARISEPHTEVGTDPGVSEAADAPADAPADAAPAPPAISRRRWLWLPIVGGVAATAVFGGLLLRRPPAPAPAPPTTIAAPTIAAPRPDLLVPAPPTVVAAPTRRPSRPPAEAKPPAVTRAPTGEPATLRIQISPWGEALLDGRLLGMSPLRAVETAAGTHEIVARHPTLGSRRQTVTLAPGEGRLLTFDLAAPEHRP